MSRRAAQLDPIARYGSDDGLYIVREKLKELSRRQDELEARLGTVIKTNVIIDKSAPPGLGLHAKTHATNTGDEPGLGTDPLDPYEMIWKRRQEVNPTLSDPDEIPLTVKATGTDQTADIVNLKEKNENDAYELTADGLSKFLGATANATVNIKPGGIAANQPDQLSIQPTWWLAVDDIGQQNDTNVITAPLRVSNVPAFGTMGAETTNFVKYFQNVTNGHAAVKQPATAGRLSVSGTVDESAGGYPTELNTVDTWTLFVVYKPVGSTITPICGSDEADAEGAQVPAIGATQGFRCNYSDGLESLLIVSPVDTSGLDTIIAIIRRDLNDDHFIFCTTTGGSGQDVTPATPVRNAVGGRRMTLDALFQTHNDGKAPADTQILEIAAWMENGSSAYLSDDDVNQLYNYAAQKYGLTQLSATGDILQCQDSTGTAQVTVDSAGFTGFGSDPTRRLEVEDDDGNPQFRIAYDSDDYCELEVDINGEMSLTCVNDGGAAAAHMIKIRRDTSLPTLADYDREFFILDRSGESKGNELYIIMKDHGGTVRAVPIVNLGTASGGIF